jgi:hypothetical protein
MREEPGSRGPITATYYVRRPGGATALLPALGVAVGVAAVAFYLAKLFVERTPVSHAADADSRGERESRTRRSPRVAAGG